MIYFIGWVLGSVTVVVLVYINEVYQRGLADGSHIVWPERKKLPGWDTHDLGDARDMGFNACLDEIGRLNPRLKKDTKDWGLNEKA